PPAPPGPPRQDGLGAGDARDPPLRALPPGRRAAHPLAGAARRRRRLARPAAEACRKRANFRAGGFVSGKANGGAMSDRVEIAEIERSERAKAEGWRLHVLMEAGYPLPLPERP